MSKFVPRAAAIALIVVGSATTTGARISGASLSAAQSRGAVDIARVLGIPRPPLPGARTAPLVRAESALSPGGPVIMSAASALSAAVMTNIGDQGVDLLGDWNGDEDLVVDHAGRVATLANGAILTRTAISEHTIANGFSEDVFYYGDSAGNVYVASTTNVSLLSPTPTLFTINLPTILGAFGTLNGDNQIVVTGLAVNPVADLTSFPNVAGSTYNSFASQTGEILYVTYTDTGGGQRFLSGQQVRSGLLAFPVADLVSPATSAPGVITPLGFPITIGGAFAVAFSTFSNIAGVAVDDDGSAYFQQVDLINFTGANIVKVTRTGTNQDRSAATSSVITISTLNPPGGNYSSTSGPATQVNGFTNYSGTSPTWGNVVALAAAPGNVLYAAVARSFVPTDDLATQNTEGFYTNPPALGPTPSMIVSLADCSGAFDGCFLALPAPNGMAEPAAAGLTLAPGVNNFRVFALGDGPDLRGAPGSSSPVFGTAADTLRLSFQVDYSIYAGLTVDEEGSVYVISGGTPAGVGLNPSPRRGEILAFPDAAPADRRADYIDLRGDVVPTPPTSANTGDGDSDRFDHIFLPAPLDTTSFTPEGIAGLSRGFLLYLNRLRTSDHTPGLPNGRAQNDDETSSQAVFFGQLDPGHQVGGGDDGIFPNAGDDSDGGGTPPIAGQAEGGFEFTFNNGGTPVSWNAFFLNSNGSITFGFGDTDNIPTAAKLVSGIPRIAPAWSDINPNGRTFTTASFPVQAIGFAGINDFKIRWINVPTFGREGCSCRNSFSISLFDDGTGLDENANQPLSVSTSGNNASPFDRKEGPTAVRWSLNAGATQFVGYEARPSGSGYFSFSYGRMDLVGGVDAPVLAGYSAGGMVPGGPNQQAVNFSTQPTRIGDGTQLAMYEFFNTGTALSPAFDLRLEGNAPPLCTPSGQADPNRASLQFTGFKFPGHAPFIDEPAIAGVTPIRVVHITELRTRVDALRARVGLAPFPYNDAIIFAGSTQVLGRAIVELRQALTDVYVAYSMPPPAFTDTIVTGATQIKAIHIQELRDLTGAIE